MPQPLTDHPCGAGSGEAKRAVPGVVYMLASQRTGTIYTGVTADMPGRLHQHRTGTGSKFAHAHGALRLVWYDEFPLIQSAISREKTIKGWPRQWKVNTIQSTNPHWHDLAPHWLLA